MLEQQPPIENTLPEQLVSSQKIGYIPIGEFPWMPDTDPHQQIDVSEMVFQDGIIYVASAIPPKLQTIASIARSQDAKLDPGEFYGKSDLMFITACHLESNNQESQSQRIGYLKGDIKNEYARFSMRAYKEAPRPNTRRLYYGIQHISTSGFTQTQQSSTVISPDSKLFVRMALTDKRYQIQTLSMFLNDNYKTIRQRGAGSK